MTDSAQINILVVGGYGVVGSLFCDLFLKKHQGANLFIASHNIEKAKQFADQLNNTFKLDKSNASSESVGRCYGVFVDAKSKNPLSAIDSMDVKFNALICFLTDPYNYLVHDACERGIPYFDITKSGDTLKQAIQMVDDNYVAKNKDVRVVWGTEWNIGLPGIAAIEFAKQFKQLESIDIISLMKTKDKSGPDSAEALVALSSTYNSWTNGKYIPTDAFSRSIPVKYPEGFQTYAYNTPNVESIALPKVLDVQNVNFYISMDDRITVPMLKFLYKSGILGLISSPRFYGLRKALLHTSGEGSSTDVLVRVGGLLMKSTTSTTKTILEYRLHCEKGQPYFTAIGSVVGIEYLLGLDGHNPSPIGNAYASWVKNTTRVVDYMRASGIDIVPASSS